MTTIQQWLKKARLRLSQSKVFNDDIELTLRFLVAARIESQRSYLSNIPLSKLKENQLDDDLNALAVGVPLPYVIEEWSFYGLDFIITPAVLIPRPETEALVEEAITWIKTQNPTATVCDIGTGSGCIAIAIAKHCPRCQVIASDISPEALAICSENVQKHRLTTSITALLADGIPRQTKGIDVLCANLPYIPSETAAGLNVSRYEPNLALDGGSDGFAVIKPVLENSIHYMNPNSLLLFEIEERQKETALKLAFNVYPHSTIQVLKDLAGKDRILRIMNS